MKIFSLLYMLSNAVSYDIIKILIQQMEIG